MVLVLRVAQFKKKTKQKKNSYIQPQRIESPGYWKQIMIYVHQPRLSKTAAEPGV